MRNLLVVLASLVIACSLCASGWALKDRFDRGARTRVEICESENALRKILHNEHQNRLRAAERKVRDLGPFIRGERKIPAGFTRADVEKSLRNAQRDIRDERAIVRQTEPRVCE